LRRHPLSSALAQETKSPIELYRTGQYEAAIAAGQTANTGEGLAAAARAALAIANLRDAPCLPCLQRAENLARRSIALDMNHPDAFVFLAVSLGYEARIAGSMRAQFAHYPEQAKEAIDKALAVAPNDAFSLAAAGAWHIEVVRNGGILARPMYGARVDAGIDYFQRAIAADPENLVIRAQYALSLAGYAFDTYKEEVTSQLNAVARIEPRTAYEGALKQRAGGLLELIKSDKRRDFLSLVSRYQGYP
jgi:tetratricopeptide (TPR) repeat protein